ncbi:ATP-binding cassette sub-family C member 4-like isoform X2 [Rhopilema esculentum]
MLLFIPYQIGLGKLFAYLRRKVAALTDQRVNIMSEVIKGMRAIKMYSWEEPFTNIVNAIRRKEIGRIKQTVMVRALNSTVFTSMPYLCGLLMFTTHYLLGETLTQKKVFSIIALLQVLRFHLNLFLPIAVQCGAEMVVACSRVQEFLELDEMKSENVVSSTLSQEDPIPYVVAKSLKASWSKSEDDLSLNGIHFDLTAEKPLLMIAGPVGAGKSSVLMALCGELPIIEGQVQINGSIAYVSQQPWIFSGTVRQNILFGQPYVAGRYKEVINACALAEDLSHFPESDHTIVGERGVCISGGQKARISLARAVYRNADIYLMDDPLSAVDTKVGRHVFEECINGILKTKIRILCTHQAQYFKYADKILGLREGKQITLASLDELIEMRFDVNSLTSEESFEKEWDRDSAVDFEEVRVHVKQPRVRSNSTTSSHSHSSSIKVASRVNLSYVSEESLTDAVDLAEGNSDEETKMTGTIPVRLYVKFFRSGGGIILSVFVLLLCLISQLSRTGVDWWIGNWSDGEEMSAANKTLINLKYYFKTDKDNNLYMFVGLTLLSFVLSLCNSLLFFNLAVDASKKLHENMMSAIMKTSLYFFDTIPVGRILNRFSKDTYFLDEEMPWVFFDVSLYGLFTINALVISAVSVPYIIIIMIPLAIAFFLLRRYYLQTARDIKRLEGISRSPMFAHLSATLEGLTTIRSSGSVDKVTEEFLECQDHQSDGWFLFISSSRWFSIRLEAILLLFIGFTVFAPMIIQHFATVDATLVGLTLIYCLQLGGLFQWCVRQTAQVESLMTSTERIVEYCNLDPEPEIDTKTVLSKGWPKYGIITAEGASFAHHKSLPYVLKTMFFCIRASEKVGVIGRTGAGKSSLIAAMFRTGKLMGTIRIDGVATSDIPLKTLRSSMSVIPQDPVLFSGTLRINIDPFNEFEDPDIWEVLEEVQLKDVVFELPNKLTTEVSEGGANFSVGQRQLLCLARALLLRKKILFIDEATANVDNDTDALIQETIKDKFRDCTVITIAHRLNTIMDCDRIMVIKAGKIVQFDDPCELFKDKDGEFKQLVNQSGNVEAARLEMMANEAKEIKQLIKERTQQTYPGCNITRSKTREQIIEIFGSRVVYETSL